MNFCKNNKMCLLNKNCVFCFLKQATVIAIHLIKKLMIVYNVYIVTILSSYDYQQNFIPVDESVWMELDELGCICIHMTVYTVMSQRVEEQKECDVILESTDLYFMHANTMCPENTVAPLYIYSLMYL